MKSLTDEDGIDGPWNRAMDRAMKADERRAQAYAQRMAKYAATIKAQQGGVK